MSQTSRSKLRPSHIRSVTTDAAPSTLTAEVSRLVASTSDLFPQGLEELTVEHDPASGRVRLHLRAVGPQPAGGRGGVTEDPSQIEGTPEFFLRWNIRGHQVIAHVAEDILLDEAPQTHARLVEIYDADPDTELRGDALEQYAAWPDIMKKDPAFKARTGLWHYVDIPFDGVSDEVGPLPSGQHVLTALPEQLGLLSSSTDPREKADALSFVTHLVGDIHQPLHCIELKNEEFPNGDRGGNEFKLVRGGNMHSLWDGFAASMSAQVVTSSGKLKKAFPREAFAARLKVTDPKEWVLESYRLGRDAYREIFAEREDERASAAYRDWGRRVAKEQSALAAYRLADLLQQVLG